MKYENAGRVLPEDLLRQIQEHVQGEYLYIPVKDKAVSKPATGYRTELERRDAHIYTKHLEGVDNKRIAQLFHLSESSVRRILLSQKKGYVNMNEEVGKVLESWGLQESKTEQIYDTVWRIGENSVLKVYQDRVMLERNLKVLDILNKMSIPAGRIIPTLDGKQYVVYGSNLYFLSQRLPGSNIVKIGNNTEIATRLGEVLADLHVAFQKCEGEVGFWNSSLLEEMNGWVRDQLEACDWTYISKEEYQQIVSKLGSIYGQLPVQLIHRDVHFGNFLFVQGEFSGYIDFDLSQRNIRVFDLCYFLLGLLSEEEKLEITKEQWFDFGVKVFTGYERKLPLSEVEKQAIPYVMECIELLFVAYFEGQNDVLCAKDAFRIFKFVRKNEDRIQELA